MIIIKKFENNMKIKINILLVIIKNIFSKEEFLIITFGILFCLIKEFNSQKILLLSLFPKVENFHSNL